MSQDSLYSKQKITDTLERNYMPYAMSVIISRAIPEIDGLKPSHRKLLFTMYKMGLLKGARTKSANVVGQTMRLNPHGDMAIYETLVRMTRGHEALLYPYIDSKGNFGKYYSRDMRFAAPRYTEVRLEPICRELFRDINQDTVDFSPNYDNTMKEPQLLPVRFPNLLVNSNQGIAVGMASNFCSYNLNDVCAATIAFLKNEKTDLFPLITVPDFPSGGELVYNEGSLRHIYETGRGSFKIRAKYHYDAKHHCVEITEIPYTTTCEAIMDRIINLVKAGSLKDINDMRDETDIKGLKLTLDVRKSTDVDKLMARLYRMTPLEDSFNCNFNVLIKGSPKVTGIKDIIREWTRFRLHTLVRQLRFEKARKAEHLHLLEGLKKILLDIDKAIRIIRATKDDKHVIPNLMKAFAIDQKQAEYIAEIKLRQLNKQHILQRLEEIERIKQEIADLSATIGDEKKQKRIVISQLKEIAKAYGSERKTSFITVREVIEEEPQDLVENYNLRLFVTLQDYLKKIPLTALRTSPAHKLKNGDALRFDITTTNQAEMFLFTNKANVYKLQASEIQDCKAGDLGEYIPNLVDLEEGESIIYAHATDDYQGHMLFAFDNGKVAKIPLTSYATKTNRKMLTNAYCDRSRLVHIQYVPAEGVELAALSSIGKVVIFHTSMVSQKTTRSSQGLQVMKAKKGSKMLALVPLAKMKLHDADYYRSKNIPAIGCYLKKEDKVPGSFARLIG